MSPLIRRFGPCHRAIKPIIDGSSQKASANVSVPVANRYALLSRAARRRTPHHRGPACLTTSDERARAGNKRSGELEKAIRKPIRPQVVRPHGLADTDRETIERANALMEELHEKAVAAARREKLKLLLRRYSLAEDDYEGLALALALEHEPGFQVVDRQIVELPLGFSRSGGFSGPVRVKDGKLIDKPSGRPLSGPESASCSC